MQGATPAARRSRCRSQQCSRRWCGGWRWAPLAESVVRLDSNFLPNLSLQHMRNLTYFLSLSLCHMLVWTISLILSLRHRQNWTILLSLVFGTSWAEPYFWILVCSQVLTEPTYWDAQLTSRNHLVSLGNHTPHQTHHHTPKSKKKT